VIWAAWRRGLQWNEGGNEEEVGGILIGMARRRIKLAFYRIEAEKLVWRLGYWREARTEEGDADLA
jgi:hypothetical protein